jgi:hypothetical protein
MHISALFPVVRCPVIAVGGWMFLSAAYAGTSANYTLAPDTLDYGGLHGASAAYVADFSAAPGGAGASGAYVLRTGFAGQLLETSGITLVASPVTIDEGGARQLGAVLVYDDSSTAPLAPDSVTWSLQSGPLANISATGLATAAAVYQDTIAVARGTYQTFTATLILTVLNILPDNFGAYAADGLPDNWQVQYFGLNNPLAAPLVDADSDGFDNRFEYNACLIPNDPLSRLSISIVETTGGGHSVTFTPRFPECIYSLFGSNDYSLWAPVAGTISDAGPIRTITDPAGAGRRRFYRLEIRRQ